MVKSPGVKLWLAAHFRAAETEVTSKERMLPILFTALLATWWAGSPQQHVPPPAEPTVLRVSSVQKLDVSGFSSYDQTQCDEHGNLYFRPVPSNWNYNRSVVMRLDPKSQFPTLFQLPSSLPNNSVVMRTSVTASGHVWYLMQVKIGKYAVLGFDDDGQFESQTDLDLPAGLDPNRFLVADDGVMLIGGYHTESATKALQGKGYLAVFDKSGVLRKEMSAASLDEVDLSTVSTKMQEDAAAAGPDGFYYLQAGEILVISEWGEIVRRIKIQRPQAAAGALRLDLSGGLISIEFYEVDEQHVLKGTFMVLDDSGAIFGVYKPAEERMRVMVCFDRRNGYLFSEQVDGKINLVSAALR